MGFLAFFLQEIFFPLHLVPTYLSESTIYLLQNFKTPVVIFSPSLGHLKFMSLKHFNIFCLCETW